jgi:hypothetical protein
MSFKFDGTNDNLLGTFTSTYDTPSTMACWIKLVTHPIAIQAIFSAGSAAASNDESHQIRTIATDNTWRGRSQITGGSADECTAPATDLDGVWAGIVVKNAAANSRTIYLQTFANSGTSSGSRDVTAIQYIAVGEALAGGSDFGAANPNESKIAECAFWSSALSDADITSYLGGTAASVIDAANLVGYWPMASNSLLNLGVDAGGDLTAGGNAVFDADHPVITTGLAPIRLIWRV